MTKLGKVKSWCIDPEDNKLTYTQHNALIVKVIDGKKFFTARHDSVDSEDYDTTVKPEHLNSAERLTMLVSLTSLVARTIPT